MRAAVERRADQVRQRLRQTGSDVVQDGKGSISHWWSRGTASEKDGGERERQQGQLRRDQLVEDMRLHSEERADQSGGVWTVEDSGPARGLQG